MFAHSHSIKNHPGQAAGLIGGAAFIGALTALLFTPRRGSEMRGALKYRSLMMKDKLKDLKKSEMNNVKQEAEDTKNIATNVGGRMKSTASKVQQDAKDTASEAKTTARDANRRSNLTP
jgi:gas vesicle protein